MNRPLGLLCAKHNVFASLSLEQIVKLAAYFTKCSRQDGEVAFQELRWESFAQELAENAGVNLPPATCKSVIDVLKTSCSGVLAYFQDPFGGITTTYLNIAQFSDETVTCLLSYLRLPDLARISAVSKSWNTRFRSVLNHKPYLNLCARHGFDALDRPFCWNLLLKVFTKQSQPPSSAMSGEGDSLDIAVASSHEKGILDDVVRTLPDIAHLHTKRSRKMIFDMLIAYEKSDPEVGYCQSMSLLAAVVVTVVEGVPGGIERPLAKATEQSYNLFSAVMKGRDVRSQYKANFPLLALNLYQLEELIKRFLPELHAHLTTQQVEAYSYASDWYLTLFAEVFPLEAVVRLWDVFLCGGWLTIHVFVLNFLSSHQTALLNCVGHFCARQMKKDLVKLGKELVVPSEELTPSSATITRPSTPFDPASRSVFSPIDANCLDDGARESYSEGLSTTYLSVGTSLAQARSPSRGNNNVGSPSYTRPDTEYESLNVECVTPAAKATGAAASATPKGVTSSIDTITSPTTPNLPNLPSPTSMCSPTFSATHPHYSDLPSMALSHSSDVAAQDDQSSSEQSLPSVFLHLTSSTSTTTTAPTATDCYSPTSEFGLPSLILPSVKSPSLGDTPPTVRFSPSTSCSSPRVTIASSPPPPSLSSSSSSSSSFSSSSSAVERAWGSLFKDSFGVTKQLLAQLAADYSLIVEKRKKRVVSEDKTAQVEESAEKSTPDSGETIANLWGLRQIDTNYYASSGTPRTSVSTPADNTHVTVAREGMHMLMKAVQPTMLKKDWVFLEQKDNVHIWRRRVEEASAEEKDGPTSISCKGVGIIPRATPMDLLLLLQDSISSGRYANLDEMCTQCSVVEQLSTSTCVIHKTFRLWRWCQAATRDYCAVSQGRSFSDGTCMLVARSVKHGNCPPVKGIIRSNVNFEGWVFKPLFAPTQVPCSHARPAPSKPEEKRRCPDCPPPKVIGTEATYVIDIELQATIPALFVNKISLQRPMVINDLAVDFATRWAVRRAEEPAQASQQRSALPIKIPNRSSSFSRLRGR